MYVVRHTVPVFVFVDDGRVSKVVVDCESMSAPVSIAEGKNVESDWTDEDEKPLTDEQSARFEADSEFMWPGWDFGF